MTYRRRLRLTRRRRRLQLCPRRSQRLPASVQLQSLLAQLQLYKVPSRHRHRIVSQGSHALRQLHASPHTGGDVRRATAAVRTLA